MIDEDEFAVESAEPSDAPASTDAAPDAAASVVGLTKAELDALAVEFADVETALARLASGDYRRCEVTGEAIPEDVLAANPLARRIPTVA